MDSAYFGRMLKLPFTFAQSESRLAFEFRPGSATQQKGFDENLPYAQWILLKPIRSSYSLSFGSIIYWRLTNCTVRRFSAILMDLIPGKTFT